MASVLVIGAGIGGIASALWLHDLALDFDWVEQSDHIGGTLLRVGNPVDEIPGIPPLDGPRLVERYRMQLAELAIGPRLNQRVVALESTPDKQLMAHFEDGQSATYRAVILSTGTTPRLLGLPHEKQLLGHGVELSVTRNRNRYAGKAVAIVGGGDAALEGAILLSNVCDDIHLIHRRDAFRGQKRFVDEVTRNPNIQLHLSKEVTTIHCSNDPSTNDPRLDGVTLNDGSFLSVQGLFVRLGVAPDYPHADWPEAAIGRSAYLTSTDLGRGALPGTYIVGDVSTADHQSVSWAMGSAARAVATINRDLGHRSFAMRASRPTSENR